MASMLISDSYSFQTGVDILVTVQTEIVIFLLAVLSYALLHGKQRAAPSPKKAWKVHLSEHDGFWEATSSPGGANPSSAECEGAGVPRRGAQQASLVRTLGATGCLEEALESIQACSDGQTYLYNILLETVVKAAEPMKIERVLTEAEAAGAANVVTFNIVLKACMQRDGGCSLQFALRTLRMMRTAGSPPRGHTFNQLLDVAGQAGDMPTTWRLMDEMQACGVKPSVVTAMNLVRSLQSSGDAADVERAVEVVESLENGIDEALLVSMVEMCCRVERPELLTAQLQRVGSCQGVILTSSGACGSVIRAYGALADVRAVWATWWQMLSNNVVPTRITLQFMVQALAVNAETKAAHELIRSIMREKTTRLLVNAAVYESILKAYSNASHCEAALISYEEMLQEGLKPSRTVFNVLIDACASCGQMRHVADILEDMAQHGFEPNLVTYASLVKGYCLEQQLDKGIDLLKRARARGFCPDELTWSRVLDGCCRKGLFERGMALFVDMLQAGVVPSNLTLAILVRMLQRWKGLEEAFEVCDRISQQYDFKPDVHVYNHLIRACMASKDFPRAMDVFGRMLKETCHPNTRTYTHLLQGSTLRGDTQEAVGLLAAVCGLDELAHSRLAGVPAAALMPDGGLPSWPVAEILEDLAHHDTKMAGLLFHELRKMPDLCLSPSLSAQLASSALGV